MRGYSYVRHGKHGDNTAMPTQRHASGQPLATDGVAARGNQLVACIDVDDYGSPIRPCPECKHAFGEHVYTSAEYESNVGECLHCARWGDRCNVNQSVAWPDLVA